MTLNTNDTSENLLTAIQQEYKILAEYKMIQMEEVGGIYVIPSHDNSFLWFGVIFVRQGFYKDGIFRFNICLPDNFPESKIVPTVVFQSDVVFHPLISSYDGTLDLSEAFPTWQTGLNHIWQILKFIRYIFLYPNDCLTKGTLPNKTAADLLSQNKAEFIAKVKECVNLSCERIYSSPPTEDKHYITFEKFNTDIHGPVLENLKKNKDNILTASSASPPVAGLSWVKEGEFKPLSKD